MTHRMLRTNKAMMILLGLSISFVLQGTAALPANHVEQTPQTRLPGLFAKVTLLNGTSRTVALDGVGCSASMCSKVVFKAKGEDGKLVGTPLDSIASITGATKGMTVLALKDGTERHVSLVPDFRVLYVADRSGTKERIDLATTRFVEFLTTER